MSREEERPVKRHLAPGVIVLVGRNGMASESTILGTSAEAGCDDGKDERLTVAAIANYFAEWCS